jgi:anti-sigma-K factor RskA
MNYDDPELRERLAGEYVLGTMPLLARRRFERLMATDATLAALVADWERRFAPLDEATEDEPPPARVWRAIDQRVAATAPPDVSSSVPTRGWFGGLAFWRGFALTAAAACAGLIAYVATLPAPAPPRVVAILADSGGEPAWVAVAGPRRGEVSVSAIRDLGGDTRHSFELWGLAGGAPKPLGLLQTAAGQQLIVRTAELPAAGGGLAISQEPPGGSPTGAPTGPVLYQGKMLATSR